MNLGSGAGLSGVGRPVSRQDLEGRIDSFFLERIPPQRRDLAIRETVPRLTWNRLDLAIKLFYLERRAAGGSDFATELYDAHIHAFSLGEFTERGNAEKLGSASFRSAFDGILNSLRDEGFDPAKSLIPAASDGSFLNGGHRAACAMFLRSTVHVVETGLPPVRYDYRFFRSRGMSDDLLEAAVVKYVERSPRATLAVLWPGDSAFATEVEARLGPLVYKKTIALTSNGLANLLNPMNGVTWPASVPAGRSGNDVRLLVHVFDRDEDPALARWLREASKDGPRSVHLPDTRQGALDLARLLLNERSVQFLNAASPTRFPRTAELAGRFRAALERSGIEREEALLGPGMVLAAFGAREAQGLGYMPPLPLDLESASPELVPRPSPDGLRDILDDPRRHFHHWGLKFLSIPEAMRVSELRRTDEDSADAELLTSMRPLAERREGGRRFVYKARFLVASLLRSGRRAIRRLGLRGPARWAYHALRRLRR